MNVQKARKQEPRKRRGDYMSLSKALDDIRVFQMLSGESKDVVRNLFDEIGPLLDQIREMFPDYTPHGLQHVID